MQIIERDWNWWAYFWRVIHRQTIKGIARWDRDAVRFILKVFDCKKGEKILDLGCGSGEHTRLLAKKGIKCVGIDIAPSLIRYAKKKIREKRAKVEYIVKDMQKINYKEEFDYCIMISSTFGFFNDYENFKLLRQIRKALKPEGKVLLDIRNAKNPRKGGRSWCHINNGYLLMESSYDPVEHREGGKYCFIDRAGKINVLDKDIERESLRLYTISEMKNMLHKAGLKFIAAYSGFRCPPVKFTTSYSHNISCNIVIIAQKPK